MLGRRWGFPAGGDVLCATSGDFGGRGGGSLEERGAFINPGGIGLDFIVGRQLQGPAIPYLIIHRSGKGFLEEQVRLLSPKQRRALVDRQHPSLSSDNSSVSD